MKKIIRWIISLFKKKVKAILPMKRSKEEIELFDLVNQYRKTLDKPIPPLKWSDKIYIQARIRNEENIESGMSHDGLPRITTALTNQGFNFVGENLAEGYPFVDSVFRAWLNSEKHRYQIEHRNWTHTGLSIYKDANGKNYFCQVFAN